MHKMLSSSYLRRGHVEQVKHKAPVESFNTTWDSPGSTNFESDGIVSRRTQLMLACPLCWDGAEELKLRG